jgi:hypothetical protein
MRYSAAPRTLLPRYHQEMIRPPRNPRRSDDADGNEIRPMSLGNMREHGVRSVLATWQETGCGHSASVNVDSLPDDFPVPVRVASPTVLGVRLQER